MSNTYFGNNVDNFERKLAKFIRVKYCVGVAFCTDAITISLLANGIGIGDEVITTNFYCVSYKSTLLANEVMSIPINPWLTENEILTVINSINEFKNG